MSVSALPLIEFTEEQEDEIYQWIEWLETTDLPQGKSCLKQTVTSEKETKTFAYCCLGIYAEFKHPEGFTEPTSEGKCSFLAPSTYYVNREDPPPFSMMVLPDAIAQDVLGITQTIPHARERLQMQLVHMNDQLAYDFHQIASELRYLLKHHCWSEEATRSLRNRGAY